MEKIGLFYSPAKGATEKVAFMVAEKLGRENIDLHLITEKTELADVMKYKKTIFGISTVGRDSWNANYEKIGWDYLLGRLDKKRFDGMVSAVFGLGNAVIYPDHFVDSMGELARILVAGGSRLVGKCSTDDYEFSSSKAIIKNKFAGLPIDEDNEEEKTEERVDAWIEQIRSEFGL